MCSKPAFFSDFEGGAEYRRFEESDYEERRRVRRVRIVESEAKVRKRKMEEQAAEADKGKKVEAGDAREWLGKLQLSDAGSK